MPRTSHFEGPSVIIQESNRYIKIYYLAVVSNTKVYFGDSSQLEEFKNVNLKRIIDKFETKKIAQKLILNDDFI